MEHNNGNGVAWTALVVAIVALILAWSAYNRAGEDLGSQVEDSLDNAAAEVEETAGDLEEELDEEFVDEDEPMDEVETETSVDVQTSN